MENKLVIKLHSTGEWGLVEGYPSVLGASGENEVTKVYIQIPTFLKGWTHFLEFAKPNGKKIVSAAMDEVIEDEVRYAVGIITSGIIDISGKYKMEYRGNKGTKVWKSKSAVTLDVYSAINAGKEVESNNPDFVSWATIRFEEIEKDISFSSRSLIHGVRFFGEDPTGERLFSSANLLAGINGAHNEFDKMYPWSDMEEIIDNAGDVFIKVPLFYVQANEGEANGETYVDFLISGVPHDGFKPHAAFIKPDGSPAKYFYIGKYEASFDDHSKESLGSKAGKIPAMTITMSQFRELANRKGNYLMDIRQYMAINLLFMIEFATRDAQSIMKGITFGTTIESGDQYDLYQPNETCNELRTKLSYYDSNKIAIMKQMKVGDEIDLGNDEGPFACYQLDTPDVTVSGTGVKDTRHITYVTIDEENDILRVGFDGIGYNIIEDYIWGWYGGFKCTGKADFVKGTTGTENGDNFGIEAISYRGIENPWGNYEKLIDGLLYTGHSVGTGASREHYQTINIGYDQSKYADEPNETYKAYASVVRVGNSTTKDLAVSGFVSKVMFVEGFEGIYLSEDDKASGVTGYCDSQSRSFPSSANESSYIVYSGGSSSFGFVSGPLRLDDYYVAWSNYSVSARLSKPLPEGD